MTPIVIYYHLNDIPGWENVFNSQFSKAQDSRLIESADKIYFCFNGKTIPNLLLATANAYPNIKIVHVSDSYDTWEYPTLDFLYQNTHAPQDDHYIFYFHLKGLTRQNNTAILDWREVMDYGNIECWRAAVAELDKGFDVCGVNWIRGVSIQTERKIVDDDGVVLGSQIIDSQKKSQNHFNGNFWWARSEYIKTLDRLPNPATIKFGDVSPFSNAEYHEHDNHWRMDHEYWLGSGKPQWSSLVNTPAHFQLDGGWHSKNLYPRERYADQLLSIVNSSMGVNAKSK
jgi:hypothetical protein